MAFQARGVQDLGLGGLTPSRVVGGKSRRRNAKPKAKALMQTTSSGYSGPDAGMSDNDIKLRDANRREQEGLADRRYYNADGSPRSQESLKQEDDDRRSRLRGNKMQNLAKVGDYVSQQTPDKDGFVTLDENTMGLMAGIIPEYGVSRVANNGSGAYKVIGRVKYENGKMQFYSDEKKVNNASPTMEVMTEAAKIGRIDNQQSDGSLNDVQNARLKSVSEALKSIDDRINSIVTGDNYDAARDFDQIQQLEEEKIGHENLLNGMLGLGRQQSTVDFSEFMKNRSISSPKKVSSKRDLVNNAKSRATDGLQRPPNERAWYNPDITEANTDDREMITVPGLFNLAGEYVANQTVNTPGSKILGLNTKRK